MLTNISEKVNIMSSNAALLNCWLAVDSSQYPVHRVLVSPGNFSELGISYCHPMFVFHVARPQRVEEVCIGTLTFGSRASVLQQPCYMF